MPVTYQRAYPPAVRKITALLQDMYPTGTFDQRDQTHGNVLTELSLGEADRRFGIPSHATTMHKRDLVLHWRAPTRRAKQ